MVASPQAAGAALTAFPLTSTRARGLGRADGGTCARLELPGGGAGGECGLTINEFEILLRLDHAGDAGLRPSDLLSAVPLTQPALSRAVARLAGRGLLARTGAPGDGRGVLISLTTAGLESLRAAIPVHAQVIQAALLDKVSVAEQDVLAEVLGRIAAA